MGVDSIRVLVSSSRFELRGRCERASVKKIMRPMVAAALGAVVLVVICAAAGLAYLRATGLTARATPGSTETRMTGLLRRFAIGSTARTRRNAVPSSPEAIADGIAHF